MVLVSPFVLYFSSPEGKGDRAEKGIKFRYGGKSQTQQWNLVLGGLDFKTS